MRFLLDVGLCGLGNVEVKRDVRDGKLKIIECGARFTAAIILLAESGYDRWCFANRRLDGGPQPPLNGALH